MKTYPKYPRKGLERRARPTQQCQVCRSAPAVGVLDIETSIFRGEDERFRVCASCRQLSAQQILDKAQEASK